MPLVTAGLMAAWWRGALPRRVWGVVVVLQLLLVAGGFTSLRSGRGEEDRVERVVQRSFVHAHEEAAEAFLWGGGIVLALTLAAAVVRREGTARALAAVSLAGTLVVFWLAYRVGDLGGRLVYQHGAASAYTGAVAPGGGHEER
jgi:hypothetical protein